MVVLFVLAQEEPRWFALLDDRGCHVAVVRAHGGEACFAREAQHAIGLEVAVLSHLEVA